MKLISQNPFIPEPNSYPHFIAILPMKNVLGDYTLMECPIRCSHHSFPNHFNFCPYCGSKLDNSHEK